MEIVIALIVGVASSYIGGLIVLKSAKLQRLAELAGDLPTWTILYEHDEKGNHLDGNRQDLIDAARKGYPIKINIFPEGDFQHGSRFEVINADLVFVEDEENTKLVTALNTGHISMLRQPNGEREFQNPAYHMFILANSNGVYYTDRYYIDGARRESKGTSTGRMLRHMKWFALVPPRQKQPSIFGGLTGLIKKTIEKMLPNLSSRSRKTAAGHSLSRETQD